MSRQPRVIVTQQTFLIISESLAIKLKRPTKILPKDVEFDKPVEEEYEVDVFEPEEKSARRVGDTGTRLSMDRNQERNLTDIEMTVVREAVRYINRGKELIKRRSYLGPLGQRLLDIFNKALNIADLLENVGIRPATEDEHLSAMFWYETLVVYYNKIIEAVETLLD
ncbi:unnamed protein product [Caenorhabditis nigoni]